MMAASNFGRRFGRFTVKSRSVCARRTVSHGQVLFAAHDAQFESAKARLSGLKEEPDNLVKLKIYAFFKQATIGQCNTPKPGMMDFVGKAKWEAWTELGDMSKDDAQLKYVQIVEELAGKEMPSPETDRSPNSGHFSDLIVDNSNGVYSIAFNRPSKKNALTRDTYEQLQQALSEAAHDDSVVVATMTGIGDYYSSGNDLSNFANIQPEQIPAMASQARDLLNRYVAAYIDFPKPLVAIVNGPAVGVSVTVLGLFDAVYAVDSATFHTPFTVLGQSAEGCSSYVFPKLMGPSKANEMLMFNRKLTAAEACERGLVTEVFPTDSFKQEAEKRISAMAKLPRQSLFKSKALIRNVERPTLHATNTRECELLQERWQSQECMNAIMKFFQGKS